MFKKISFKNNFFDVVEETQFQEFQHLNLSSLITDFFQSQGQFDYVTIGAFKDGLEYPVSAGEREIFLSGSIDQISKLQCSFRITNIHLVNKLVKKIVDNFYNKHNIVSTVNLYVTPSLDSQCFLYHGDPHDSLIYQILGEKEWSFPKIGENYAFLKPHLRSDASVFNNKTRDFNDEITTIKAGDAITFPFNMIHKAQNRKSSISAHLTFSTNFPNAFDLKNYIIAGCLGLNDYNGAFYQEAVEAELPELLKRYSHEVSPFIENYFLDFAAKEKDVLALGKRY